VKTDKDSRAERAAEKLNFPLMFLAVGLPVVLFLYADGLPESLIVSLFFTATSIALIPLSQLKRMKRFAPHVAVFGLFWIVLAYSVSIYMADSENEAAQKIVSAKEKAEAELALQMDRRLSDTDKMRKDIITYNNALTVLQEAISGIRNDLSDLSGKTAELKSSLDATRMYIDEDGKSLVTVNSE